MSVFRRFFVVRFLTGAVDVFDDFAGDATIQEIERGGRIVEQTDDANEAQARADLERAWPKVS